MATYLSKTKKGSVKTAKGEVSFTPFNCSKRIDPQEKGFKIEVIDEQTLKSHSINLYGKDVIDLYYKLNNFLEPINLK